MAVMLNRYSAVLPGWAVLLIWLVPLVLLIIWVVKEEKAKELVKNVRETPISYSLMGIVFIAALTFATPILRTKLASGLAEKHDSRTSIAAAQPQPTPLPRESTPSSQPNSRKLEAIAPRSSVTRIPTGGIVDQSGDGCQQKIVGGSYNTNNCFPGINQDCPNGICNAGPNYGTQTVDNRHFGDALPPPNIIGLSVGTKKDKPRATPLPLDNLLNYPEQIAEFTVDRTFLNPIFLVTCDRPCVVASEGVIGTSSPRFLSTSNPLTAGVALGTTTPLLPGTKVAVDVRSKDSIPIRILKIEPYIEQFR